MKTKLGYMVLGAVLGIGGMLVGMSLSPVTAQVDKFGVITCTGLNVVDADEKLMVKLGANELGGVVAVINSKTGKADARMIADECGGSVSVYNDKTGEAGAHMFIDEEGGRVSALSKDLKSEVTLLPSQSGGFVTILRNREPRAIMGVDEEGATVIVVDKDGKVCRL